MTRPARRARSEVDGGPHSSTPTAHAGIALIAGLGNPGKRYAATRHNAGFQFIERLQHQAGFRLAGEKRFRAEVGGVVLNGRRVRVMAPDTFMNLSGQAVASLAAFYRIPPEQILVVHDDLDLAPGCARLKLSGGHGGHNGLRDIVKRLGSGDFPRLRLGIGHPGARRGRDVSAFVLAPPRADELLQMEEAMARALEVLDQVVVGDFAGAMNRLHGEPGGGAESTESNRGI